MSNDHGGPPNGRSAPLPGRYGPGHTVLAQPAFTDEPPIAGSPLPPTTVREESFGAAPSPYAPPVYGAPPPPSPYDAPPVYGAPQQVPFGVPPPPPPARARTRGSQGPSLVVIGAVSAVVIGGAVTTLAIVTRPASDDKPVPTIDVPAATNVPKDPGTTNVPSDTPTNDPPPVPTPPPPTAHKPLYPTKPIKPGTSPTTRPPNRTGPGGIGPSPTQRQPPPPPPPRNRSY